jgi:tetratricopeptide (TPR) repeat protein
MRKCVILLLALLASVLAHAQFNTDRLIMTGHSALYYKDYVLSIQYFNQAINAKPYLYEPWFYRGVAKYYLDDYTGAEQDISVAIKLNPYIADMYDLRGLCRIKIKDYDNAIADYDKALQYDPRNQGYWYNRALCRVEKQDLAHAQLDLDTIVSRWQKFSGAYALKAEVYLQQKDTTKADQWLNKTLEVDPYNADAWQARAMISLTRQRWKDADTFLSKAIHLKSKTVTNYINRALARLNINNLRGAMDDYDMALDLEPTNFLGHYNRGLLRMQLGDDNRAITDFDYVIKLEPKNMLAIFNRGVLHEKTGNLQAAIRDYSTVIASFPNFWTGLQNRARCYWRLGMKNKAELDQFRILKAQMDKHIGVQPRWSRNKAKLMRKRSEIDPDKYDQIVVADDNNVEREYKSEYRGRVQDHTVSADFMPMYCLSFFKYKNGVKTYQAFSRDVEKFNTQEKPVRTIYVTCNPDQLDEMSSKRYLLLADSLTARIVNLNNVNQSKALLMDRAVAYSVLQNYDAAITDLTTYLQIDSTSVLALWQRGVCQTLFDEFNASQGVDVQVKAARTKADFDEALRRSPNNSYLYYDRGNLYAMKKDYARAIDDYTMAITLDANLAEAYYNRGLARIYSNNKSAGVADLSKAGELGLYNAYHLIKRYTADK